MKKTLPFCMILALLLTAPALASGNKYNTTINAVCNLPDISVIVPKTGEVFINPYQLPVSIEADESTAQIISTPGCIENQSVVPISVTVTVTSTIREGSSMRLVTTPTGGVGTRKQAFIYFEMQASNTSSPPQSIWASEYDAEQHVLLRAGTTRSWKDMVALDATDGENCFGVFRLSGDCVYAPRSAWTENDGIDVEIAFTFTALGRPGI